MHRIDNPETPPPSLPFGRAPYRTREWKELREQVFRRDNGCCRSCGAEVRGKDWRLGHEQPHGGDATLFWDRANLLLICKRCNEAAKRAVEPRAFSASDADCVWPGRLTPK